MKFAAALFCLLAIGLRSSAPIAADEHSPPVTGLVWQAGREGYDRWVLARDGQCGTPHVAGSTFTFTLVQQGAECIRNQAHPADSSGEISRLTDGKQYTWTFRYVDGDPKRSAGGMGYDPDARSLIWQIHPYAGGNPCVSLGFWNGGSVGDQQQWFLSNCAGNVWSGSYHAGEVDDWKIVLLVTQNDDGYIRLYRNGTLVANAKGATYTNSHGGFGDPWWNFGPYKWRWKLPDQGGSRLAVVRATITGMTVTSP